MKIVRIEVRQILDSRGNPTVEADVWLDSGEFGRASVPSGASTGEHEAHELRDGGHDFGGLGVKNAIKNIHEVIQPILIGINADDQRQIDDTMRKLDGTENKANLGANAILAVSLAVAHAAAKERGVLLYTHINDIAGNPVKSIPIPMMNVLNGGKHASGSSDIQECMILPIGASNYFESIKIGSEIFQNLKSILTEKGYSTTVGDEGGFAPAVVNGNSGALSLLSEATQKAGYELGKDVAFALDVASSELFKDNLYNLSTEHRTINGEDMIGWYESLIQQYPIVSIEDGLSQDDWSGWQMMTERLRNVQLVGDDLLVTNTSRLERAISEKCGNSILIKPNQIGTLSETLDAIAMAKKAGWNTIVSHRSGETEDTTIVHIAIGTGAGQIKTGSLSRSERTAKHNEILRIEQIDPTIKFSNPFRQ